MSEEQQFTELEPLTDQQQQELDNRSESFLGRWNQLISSTNWEKGRIVSDWQKTMEKSGLPKSSYTDERWSLLAGGATPQHVGRLRRTFARFGHVHKEYEGLYWSHFYAALDWEDAEMWLEGALQNSWSVSRMRNVRWETMGKRPDEQPRVEQIVVSEVEEEVQSLQDPTRISKDRDYIEGPLPEGPDFGDAKASRSTVVDRTDDLKVVELRESTAERIRPFESFTDLPDDIRDAANTFKVAIIKHKAAGWENISLDDLYGLLDALKALATSTPE